MRARALPLAALLLVAAPALALGCGEAAGELRASPAHGWLALVRDGELRLIDAGSGLEEPLGPVDAAPAPAWSPNGQLLAFVRDGVIQVVRPGGTPRALDVRPRLGSGTLAWSPGGLELATVAEDGAVLLVGIAGGATRVVHPPGVEPGGWWHGGAGASDQLVVREPAGGRVHLVDVEAAVRRSLLTAVEAAPAPRDARIAYTDAHGVVRVWSPFAPPVTLAGGGASQLAWSPDGRSLAVTLAGGVAIASGGGGPPSIVAPGAAPAWSHDGALLSLEEGGALAVIEVATGLEVWRGAGTAAAWQPAARETLAFAGPPLAGSDRDPRNLLAASRSFEAHLAGWLDTGDRPPASARTTEDSVRGDAAAQVRFDGVNSWFAVPVTGLKAALEGQALTFSAWVRATDPCVHVAHGADGASILAGSERSAPHPGDGRWHRLEITFTPDYDSRGPTTFIDVGVRCDGDAVALVDAVQLEFGAAATDFEAAGDDPLSALPRGEPVPAS